MPVSNESIGETTKSPIPSHRATKLSLPSSPKTCDNSTPLPVHPTISRALNVKKKRIRFTQAWDLMLLKAVSATTAHTPPHGETIKRFEEALKLFLAAAPKGNLDMIILPNAKTLWDRFTNIIEKRRAAVRKNEAATGIDEVYGEGEQLMDDLILEINEEVQRKKAVLEERNKRENVLLEEIRTVALARKRKKADATVEPENESEPGERPPTPKKQKCVSAPESDDERELIRREVKRREQQERERLCMERERFDLEKKSMKGRVSALRKERVWRKSVFSWLKRKKEELNK